MKYVSSLLMAILLLSATCVDKTENCHKTITIVNNSDQAIYYYPSSSYPDTLIPNINPAESGKDFKIEMLSGGSDIHLSCIEGKFLITSKYMYFFYDAHTLETTPWDTVVKNYLILKRFELSLKDLQRMNWTISYP